MTGIDNPLGTDGFEFVMFTSDNVARQSALFEKMGIPAIARHKKQDITLHRSGEITLLVNGVKGGHAEDFAKTHGPSACGMAFRVKYAEKAYKGALERGATAVEDRNDPINARAIEGIGGARVYLIDQYGDENFYADDFELIDGKSWDEIGPTGLKYLDHLTHNVRRGQMKVWADYYERIFNFREIRHFDIEGKKTGLFSKAMTSPDGNIKIPLNESQDDKSQIEEFIREYNGEGIQHIALETGDIYKTIPDMRERGVIFQDTPETYYELIDKRLPEHSEDVAFLKDQRILIDGGEAQGGGFLLQIFMENSIGPIFFEIIQRKGNEGFGEGNFKALFESIELDQERRGVI
ncbi:4-hydroxyphenylpyruvate dioxygenase [Parvularcula flava]|uniref:4-hydroxyphenylpyruvate dioxygenase n=1 Tax=Aquisalinus luteolus TaxID=1566827 RepID=A0A8J3A1D4_9PROT|nr:4-hydroxyphenylpyruvate dioxygenase [Aquisalinus luteolus]NHK27542.1 4-hydroxyphenylpyruvate dioxygenase [Aquisalinus luteolus]GGH95751.1 4-hydroxyphenylpyruvate dioxygenase [Aquisalinus luteolus]